MKKPKILVTAASGNTGSPTAAQLLEKGYPVRAMVRASDQRSEKLRRLGAEIFVGNLDDIADVRSALQGVQRAYYCAPFSRDSLATSLTFAVAAQEQQLEMVTVMSQWLADPTSPSVQTRQVWLSDQLFSWLPGVPSVTVNPGWFADNYRLAGLDVVAQTGVMMLPLGEGLNAPPSNEDIARVVVGTLSNPESHIGKTYRPTGPHLLSPPQIAEVFGKALGRRVRYQDAPTWLFPKVAKAVGLPDFVIAQLFTYFAEYKRNAFGIGAPTGAVFEVSGQEPEAFETVARRYLAATPNVKRGLGGLSRATLTLMKAMLTPGLNLDAYTRQQEFPRIRNVRFAEESAEWRATHGSGTASGAPVKAVVATSAL
jgi:NAD(P)H dehydrogenase (quinone)